MAFMPDSTQKHSTDVPYTLIYIKQLLETDESEIIGLSDALRLSPQKDQTTGQVVYNYREVQMLRKALQMMKQGSSLKRIQTHFGIGTHQEDVAAMDTILEGNTEEMSETALETFEQETKTAMNLMKAKDAEAITMTPESIAMEPSITSATSTVNDAVPATVMKAPQPVMSQATQVAQRLTHDAQQLRSMGKENIAIVVESIANAREGMIQDMSRMLDDKLAGLDEVVVELIRCKSENDALKKKVESLTDEKESLEYELSRYHSTGFGFYRKN